MKTLNVGMIGYKFMGKTHSNAWRQVDKFFPVAAQPVLHTICGRDKAGVRAAAKKFGWGKASTSWQDVIADPAIDVLDINTANDTHAEISIAAAKAGKHVLCEKPLAMNVREAKAMLDAVKKAGVGAHDLPQLPAHPGHRAGEEDDRGWGTSAAFSTTARAICRTGSSTRNFRSCGGCRGRWRAAGRTATSTRTSSTWGAISSANSRRFAGTWRRSSRSGRCRLEEKGARDGGRRGGDAGPVPQRRDGVPGGVALCRGAQEPHSARGEREQGLARFDFEDMNRLKYFSREDGADRQGYRDIIVTEGVHPYVGAWVAAGGTSSRTSTRSCIPFSISSRRW